MDQYIKYKSQYLSAQNGINTHILFIQNPPDCPTFDYIKSGIKTVEGRQNTSNYQKYKSGDILIFQYKQEKLKTIIKDIRKYKTLEDYLSHEGFDKVLPCAKTYDEAIKIYNRWSTSESREKLREQYGYSFLAIHIEIIK